MSKEGLAEVCHQLVADGKAEIVSDSAIKIVVDDPVELKRRFKRVEVDYAKHFDKRRAEYDREVREATKKLHDQIPHFH